MTERRVTETESAPLAFALVGCGAVAQAGDLAVRAATRVADVIDEIDEAVVALEERSASASVVLRVSRPTRALMARPRLTR